MSDVTKYRNQPPAFQTWEFEYRWGSLIGDVRKFRIRRVSGGQMSISLDGKTIEIRPEHVQIVAEMIAEAAAWSDEEGEADEPG